MSVISKETTERVLRAWYGAQWASEHITRAEVLEVMMAAGLMDSIPGIQAPPSDLEEPIRQDRESGLRDVIKSLEISCAGKDKAIRDLESCNRLMAEQRDQAFEKINSARATLAEMAGNSSDCLQRLVLLVTDRLRGGDQEVKELVRQRNTVKQSLQSVATERDAAHEALDDIRGSIGSLKRVHTPKSLCSDVEYLRELAGLLEESKALWAK